MAQRRKKKKIKVDKRRFKKDKKYAIGVIIFVLLTPVMDMLYDSWITKRLEAEATIVTLEKCVDGDTAYFHGIGKTRFLYIDTPESTNKIEPYGKEAAAYTCSMLENANEIKLVFDGDRLDKYNRVLAWVFVDDVLLQEELTRSGLVKKFYDYGDYAYEARMLEAMQFAQDAKNGIFSE
ncbi:MAG: thermonuclease family protein [Erysipelotrichaceae bacterium]